MSIEIIIGILGLIIAWLTFKYTFFSKPKEELDHLKILFKSTQRLSLDVRQMIEKYIKNNNAENKLMFENATFGNYLKLMKESFKENLSDELFDKIDKSALTKTNISSMINSLEKQFKALQEIQLKMELLNSNQDSSPHLK